MKKLNKFFAVLVALAMMAMLSVTAFAADPVTPTATDAQIAAPENAKLVKYLKIDEGVTIPDEDFVFDFTFVSSTTGAVVNIPQQTINARDMTPSKSVEDDGALVGTINLSTFIKDNMFTKTGEYVYTVKELAPADQDVEAGQDAKTNTEGMTYSDQNYTLRVYVTNDANGNIDASKVTVENNDQKDEDPATTGTKVDPTDADPSDGEDKDDPSDDLGQDDITKLNVEGFTFINSYELPEDLKPLEDGAVKVTKATTGTFGDKTQVFPITITVAWPEDGSYDNGDKALNIFVGNTDKGALEADASPATTWSKTVEIKDGETAYFKNLPDGAVVTVTEDLTGSPITNAEYYKQTSKTVTKGGTAVDQISVVDGDGTAVAKDKTDKTTIVKTKLTSASIAYANSAVELEKNNTITVTNENLYDPGNTGILMSNLPYIVLALVAIGGMVAYVVIRRRQSDEA